MQLFGNRNLVCDAVKTRLKSADASVVFKVASAFCSADDADRQNPNFATVLYECEWGHNVEC
jgi:hypothetical protein